MVTLGPARSVLHTKVLEETRRVITDDGYDHEALDIINTALRAALQQARLESGREDLIKGLELFLTEMGATE